MFHLCGSGLAHLPRVVAAPRLWAQLAVRRVWCGRRFSDRTLAFALARALYRAEQVRRGRGQRRRRLERGRLVGASLLRVDRRRRAGRIDLGRVSQVQVQALRMVRCFLGGLA